MLSTIFRKLFLENATQKALALALAVTVVVFVREDQLAQVTASVPVRVSYPGERILVSEELQRIQVTLEGKYSAIRKFDADSLPPFDIALTGNEREQYAIEPEAVKVPPGLTVRAVRPAAMFVRFEEKRLKRVPVVPHLVGEPAAGYRLTQAGDVQPLDVGVEGAASVVDAIKQVETAPVDLTGRNQSAVLEVGLAPAPARTTYLGPAVYKVGVTIEEKLGTRVVTGRPVEIRNVGEGSDFEVLPPTADVTLHGPVRLLDALDVERLVAYVDAKDLAQAKRPAHARPLGVDAPDGLKLVELKPAKVTLVRLPEPKPEEAPEVSPPDSGAAAPERGPDDPR